MAEIVRAESSFRAGSTLVSEGDLFYSDDPVVVSRRHLFGPVAGAVRTTATVPGVVTAPPPAKKATKQAKQPTKTPAKD